MNEDILETTAAIASGDVKTRGQRFDRYQDHPSTNKSRAIQSSKNELLQYPLLVLNLVKSGAKQALSYTKTHRTQALTMVGILGAAGIGYMLRRQKKTSAPAVKSQAKKQLKNRRRGNFSF